MSCDRCHRIKAKCVFTPGISSCGRCNRLQHNCTKARVFAQRGRRRKDDKFLLSKGKSDAFFWVDNASYPNQIITNHYERPKETAQNFQGDLVTISRLIQFPPPEYQLLETLWSHHFVSDFVIGPSFARFFQDMLRRSFANSPEVLRDTHLATAAAFLQTQRGGTGNESLNLNRTSMSIERLRCFRATDRSQLALLSGLGLSIVTFEILIASAASHAIVAHTLLSLKPWIPVPTRDPELDFNLNALILLDTVNCLMYREVPIIRYEPTDEIRIDRSVGICCDFLPIMYDACLVSHKRYRATELDQLQSVFSWSGIKLKIQEWSPVEPSGFIEMYQDNEIVAMRTQASIYQNAVLLLIHRMQHPYGGIDEVGMSWSKCILSSLETCFRVTGSYPLPTFFPLLVASLEVTDHPTRQDIMGAIETRFQLVFCQFLMKMKRFLQYVWEARDSGCFLSWEQIIHATPKMFFLP